MTTTWHRSTETFTITEEILVRASLEQTFASLVAQMGRLNQTPDGKPLPMVLEPHPGGRWYRDLGGDNGHLWGFVQSIKRPALLEIWGPLFMSTAATSNLHVPAERDARRHADQVHAHARRAVPRRPSPALATGGRRCTRASARPPKRTAAK